MKNVYIGKLFKDNTIAICKVIDSDIATGNAIVFNRGTNKIEIVTSAEKHTLWSNIRKLAEDTENEYIKEVQKALAEYNAQNPLMSL